MIGNVHGENDKAPSPSGSQHIMLHVIQGITQNIWEDDIFKSLEINISRSMLINEQAIQAPNTAGINRTLCGTW